MNTKTLTILIVITAVVAVVAFVSYSTRTPPTDIADSELLFPELESRVNDVHTMSITAGPESFRVTRADDGTWMLANRGGYPVKFEQVRNALVGLGRLEIVEPKTSRPENYGRIGVGEPAADDKAMGVVLEDELGQTLASLIIGDRATQGQSGRYVRRSDEAQSWLVTGRLEIDKSPLRWVETTILRMGRDRIRSVSVTHPDGECVYVSRREKEQRDFELADLPADRELTSPGAPNTVASGFSFVRMEDVAPRDAVAFNPDTTTTVELHTFGGLGVVIEMDTVEGEQWGRLNVSFEAPPEPADAPETEDAAAVDDDEAENDEQAEAAELKAALDPWVFRLSASTAGGLSKRLADLTSEKPEPEPEPEAEAEPEPAETPVDGG